MLAAALAPRAGARMRRPDVLPRLAANLRVLTAAYVALADDVHHGVLVAPAAEWLLDNFHLVKAEARAVHQDLPATYYRTLPKATTGGTKGQARIHTLAVELIRHGNGRLDDERLTRFIFAFQTIVPLTLLRPGDGKSECQAMMTKHQEIQDKLEAMDATLDELVAEMNATKICDEADAMDKPMAAVLTELVAQRKASRAMMMEMQPEMMAHMRHHMRHPWT